MNLSRRKSQWKPCHCLIHGPVARSCAVTSQESGNALREDAVLAVLCGRTWGGSMPLLCYIFLQNLPLPLNYRCIYLHLAPCDFHSHWDISAITAQMIVVLSLYRWYSFVQQSESYAFLEHQHLRARGCLLAVRAVKLLPLLVWCWLFYHLRLWVCSAKVFLGSVFSDSHPERLPIAALSKIFFVWKYWAALWISGLIINVALRRSFKP